MTTIERLQARLATRCFGGDQDEKDVAELLHAHAVALKELEIIYDRHDVGYPTINQCHAQAEQLVEEGPGGRYERT